MKVQPIKNKSYPRALLPFILAAAFVLTTSFALCGCSDEPATAGGRVNGIPVTFRTQVDGLTLTRSTADDSQWDGGEAVGIQIDDGKVKSYTVAPDGSGILTATDPNDAFYWQEGTDPITVNAWYPYNAVGKPALEVKPNQSTATAFGESDLLEAVDVTVAHGTGAALTFSHRTAKVIVVLKAGEKVAADAISKADITFINQTGVAGNGGTVIPYKLTGIGRFAALLAPQQMMGKKFIRVTVGADSYSYIPTGSNDALLSAGNRYVYTITLRDGGGSVTVSSGTWTINGIPEDVPTGSELLPGGNDDGNSWTDNGGAENVPGGSGDLTLDGSSNPWTGDSSDTPGGTELTPDGEGDNHWTDGGAEDVEAKEEKK